MKFHKTSLLLILLFNFLPDGYAQLKPGNKERPLSNRRQPLSAEMLRKWPLLDPWNDSVPGISLSKASAQPSGQLTKTKKVIIAIIDGGVDINHDMLRNAIWVNQKEIPDNGIDDDNNGYVDDIHGWNFLGKIQEASLELTRMVRSLSAHYEGKHADRIEPAEKPEYDLWKTLNSELKKQVNRESQRYDAAVSGYDSATASAETRTYIRFLEDMIKYRLNITFDPKETTGDDPDNPKDKKYGDNDVRNRRLQDDHGTHVSGIIQTVIAEAVKAGWQTEAELMILRAVPSGDEYDKDIALAIRYAADNGANIINMSLGKKYSPHPDWVWEAISYAEKKNVLIVKAAGNDFSDLDKTQNFPSDTRTSFRELADNMITVGSLNPSLNENIVSGFSNYGKHTVDLFAPGSEIFSSLPDNRYGYRQGTSMSAPFVSGVAAVLMFRFPHLSAGQVKHILIASTLKYDGLAIIPGSRNRANTFLSLSVSGGILNADNAIRLAGKISHR